MSQPPLPPGARLLSADEATEILITGDHAQADAGSRYLDKLLIHGLQTGMFVACLTADGCIAFTRRADTAPTPPVATAGPTPAARRRSAKQPPTPARPGPAPAAPPTAAPGPAGASPHDEGTRP